MTIVHSGISALTTLSGCVTFPRDLAYATDDDLIDIAYAQVLRAIQVSGTAFLRNEEPWARLFLENDGDEQETIAAYFAERVDELKAERIARYIKAEEAAAMEAQNEAAAAKAAAEKQPDPAEVKEALKRAEEHQRFVGMYGGKAGIYAFLFFQYHTN